MYVDYAYYASEYGGEIIPEKKFSGHERRAEAYIRKITYVRGDIFSTESDMVKDAVCAVADVYCSYDQKQASAGMVKSENNDGYSVTYVTEQTDGQTAEEVLRKKLMRLHLHICFQPDGYRERWDAVMLANATITIYNRKAGSKTTFDTWNRTVIRGVHVYVDHKVSAGDSGLNSAEVYKIRIPADAENADQYLPPEEYAELENPAGYWTIQNDDHIVLGECSKDIVKPADLLKMSQRHCKVLSWSDNRFGGLSHWRIGGA